MLKIIKTFLMKTRTYSTIKKIELYKKCYAILGVNEFADQNTVRRAYIDLVKLIHPDSGKPSASAEKFQEIDMAFKILQSKFAKNKRGIPEDEEEKVFDINHTAPQHRQYLSYDGIGVGTPFQRQKQYQHDKAMKAQERVLNHRIEKAQAGEKSLIQKSGFFKKHAIKTKYGFERVVEDLIQEAMSKGDFDNLSCSGKPLPSSQSQNPYLDFSTAKLNQILIENGFTPEWISLQRVIRDDILILKNKLKKHREIFGEVPLNDNESIQWNVILNSYESDERRINKNIDKLNLIVPILDNQMCRIRLQHIGNVILNDTTLQRNKQVFTTSGDTDNKHTSNEKKNFFTFLNSLF